MENVITLYTKPHAFNMQLCASYSIFAFCRNTSKNTKEKYFI